VKVPKHFALRIEHQPHALDYRSVEAWLEEATAQDLADVTPEDAAEMVRTGEVWLVRWYPQTPVGWCAVAAPTLERALELANR
jgi:hypothetical protein